MASKYVIPIETVNRYVMSYLCRFGKTKPLGTRVKLKCKESTIKRDSELNSDNLTLHLFACLSSSSQSLKLSLTMYCSSSKDNHCNRPG